MTNEAKNMGVTLMDHGYPNAAIAALADRLRAAGPVWVLGGSTGLAIRGAQLGRAPRDLDIYADEEDVLSLHALLAEYALDEPAASETDRYRSILSHYSLEGIVVELVGGFRVRADESLYRTEVRQMLYPSGESFDILGRNIRLVPLGHELIFNVLRERPDRCEMAGSMIRGQSERHLPALRALLRRNPLSAELEQRIRRYAGDPDQGGKAGGNDHAEGDVSAR